MLRAFYLGTVPKKIKLQNEFKISKVLDTFSKIVIWNFQIGKMNLKNRTFSL